MKVSVFGSCRQDSISRNFTVSAVKDALTYPHYTKEILQAIRYCKGIFPHDNSMTQYCFRTGILEKRPILCQSFLQKEFEESAVVVVEIASRLCYEWNGLYVHHILTEEPYGFHDRANIQIRSLSDTEIAEDLLAIQDLVFPKKLVVVSHIHTRTSGKRYELIQLLETLTTNLQIPFINPSVALAQYSTAEIYVDEPLLSHYTPFGHTCISQVYKSVIPVRDVDSLRVYASKYPKRRIGTLGDGGYVLVDLPTYDALISCGISDNIDFEEAFLKQYPNLPCHAFDGTIQALPHPNEAITFYKKNIGTENTETTTNLHELISSYGDIFLKMDIETYELRWLHTMSVDHLKRCKQIVMEFHFPTSIHPHTGLDIQIPVVEKMAVFQKLAATHWLVHFHGNNVCGTMDYKGIRIPNVFECTFIRKDQQDFCGLNPETIPSRLDTPNIANMPDIFIDYPPFVYTQKS